MTDFGSTSYRLERDVISFFEACRSPRLSESAKVQNLENSNYASSVSSGTVNSAVCSSCINLMLWMQRCNVA